QAAAWRRGCIPALRGRMVCGRFPEDHLPPRPEPRGSPDDLLDPRRLCMGPRQPVCRRSPPPARAGGTLRRLIVPAVVALLLAGCMTPRARVAERQALAASMPVLRLPPSALPGALALQQRLAFRHGERRQTVDALVENDAAGTRLLIHAQGQVALRL